MGGELPVMDLLQDMIEDASKYRAVTQASAVDWLTGYFNTMKHPVMEEFRHQYTEEELYEIFMALSNLNSTATKLP